MKIGDKFTVKSEEDGQTYRVQIIEDNVSEITCYKTYENIMKKILSSDTVYISTNGFISHNSKGSSPAGNNLYNIPSKKDAERVQIFIKLINVAAVLNDGWAPDWNNNGERKYKITMEKKEFRVDNNQVINAGMVYFKTEALAKQAIQIIGERELENLFA
jgi:hypothetical protein